MGIRVRSVWLVFCLSALSLFLFACENSTGQTAPRADNHNRSQKETSAVAKSLAQRRYTRPSTEVNFILVTIQKKSTGEQAVVVIDNTDWITYCAKMGIPVQPHEKYVEYMTEHGNEPFVMEDVAYDKLSRMAAAEPSAELRAMSREDIAKKYFREFERDYTLADSELCGDASFLRLLLEKGFIVKIGCESGVMFIRF